jgi:hypothetical protein
VSSPSAPKPSWTRSARRGKAPHSGVAPPAGQVAMFDAGITPPESEVREFADQARALFD